MKFNNIIIGESMLPDLPLIKKRLLKIEMDFVHWATREQMPAFGDARSFPIYEGHQTGVERATGDTEVNDMLKTGVEIETAPHEDDLNITFGKLYDMGTQFAESIEKNGFKRLNETLEKCGRTVNANGVFNVDVFFQVLSDLEYPLNAEGNIDLNGMKFVAGSKAYDAFVRVQKEIEQSPKLQERMKKILEKKQEEARAREADRKLVG